MSSKTAFHNAAKRLLGEPLFNKLLGAGYSPNDFCREIAQSKFICVFDDTSDVENDLETIRAVAKRLWIGDGVTGLE